MTGWEAVLFLGKAKLPSVERIMLGPANQADYDAIVILERAQQKILKEACDPSTLPYHQRKPSEHWLGLGRSKS